MPDARIKARSVPGATSRWRELIKLPDVLTSPGSHGCQLAGLESNPLGETPAPLVRQRYLAKALRDFHLDFPDLYNQGQVIGFAHRQASLDRLSYMLNCRHLGCTLRNTSR